jgi:hypothetical protein
MPMIKAPDEESSADEVPAYIVTFSDMVTLLLTFFVLLLSLADVQDPELFNKGRDSLVKAISHCGLGIFKSQTIAPGHTTMKTRYKTHEADPTADRTIDEERERLQRLFERINQSMTTIPSQINTRQPQFFSLPIQFAQQQERLPNQGRVAIKRFAANLLQHATPQDTALYVLALGNTGGTSRDSFLLSAQRAQGIATYLRTLLPNPSNWSINSWGAGPGGQWSGPNGMLDKQSKVMIAVLKQ